MSEEENPATRLAPALSPAVEGLIAFARNTLLHGGTSRHSLAVIRLALLRLATRSELFPPEAFPLPQGQAAVLYTLHTDTDESMTLYVDVCGPDVFSPPHDHGTWALIAGLQGYENNRFYQMVSGDEPAAAPAVKEVGQLALGAGKAIALMPDDIHSIATGEQARVMCLHFYGLSLPRQTTRRAFGLPGQAPSHYAPQPEIRSWPYG